MSQIHAYQSGSEAARGVAESIATRQSIAVRERGRFTLVLSGGLTPRALYELLATSEYSRRMEWRFWHVFWGDERMVPPDHSDSNFLVAKESLLDYVQIPESQVHRIRGEIDAEDAAAEYVEMLEQVFSDGESLRVIESTENADNGSNQRRIPVFDMVLLGMGGDGHTASLFPGGPALRETERLVVESLAPDGVPGRVTMTLPLINAARTVAFLVTDTSKAGVLQRVHRPPTGVEPLPAARVRPRPGTLHWYVTEDAQA